MLHRPSGNARTFAIIALCLVALHCQSSSERGRSAAPDRSRISSSGASPSEPRIVDTLVVAFYNVENLFDPTDDPETDDDDFTPSGSMKWNDRRLDQKLENISRALRLMDSARGPDIVGFAEVENRRVLEMLTNEFLPGASWKIVHFDSPDGRGIDVALIARSGAVSVTRSHLHPINLGPRERPTRGILVVDMISHRQPFTILVNHWPSRYGGRARSEWKRVIAANTAAAIVDSITADDPVRDIIMMGDLNDEPDNRSVSDELDAVAISLAPQGWSGNDARTDARLFDLAASDDLPDTIGTYLYDHRWQILDHIIVSPGLLDHAGLSLLDRSMTIFATPFLRDTHPSVPMNPPRRTYIHGTLYIGGTSDHFPVYGRFIVMK